ncbi:low molecular weight protein arginine phosphatase [Anaerotalea alkaliphila]|uniref:Low molecular weight protein arginine phosphatase n=1 Tax=Anaerotalea alkaliphila TaxID=2662126 RepID=A0A7X5KM89_9FIRM|nr:low molecular weight protein arginine phosphatase [Anaerotalea alkaliphila]NDL66704.1 low molecular weight protein arginine phosphatase [Anaerotalea alkaliphila]
MDRIIFVCTGNTCRSPMAEGLFKKIIPEFEGVVLSRGLAGANGMPPSPQAVEIMKEYDIHIEKHRSKMIEYSDLSKDTLILAMTRTHQKVLETAFPEYRSQIRTLLPFAGGTGDVPDPYGGSLETYRTCAGMLQATIMNIRRKVL